MAVQDLPTNWTSVFSVRWDEISTFVLAPGETKDVSLAVAIPNNVSITDLSMTAVGTSLGKISSVIGLSIHIEKCNLQVVKITYDPSHVVHGDLVYIKVRVRNSGIVDCENATIRLYENGQFVAEIIVERFRGWTDRFVFFQWTPRLPGLYRLSFVIDPDDRIEEINENDNVLGDKVTVTTGERWPDDRPCFHPCARSRHPFLDQPLLQVPLRGS